MERVSSRDKDFTQSRGQGEIKSRTFAVSNKREPQELKPFLLKVAIVCEDLGEGMPAHGVHGNTVSEAIVLIRTLFIQRETLEE